MENSFVKAKSLIEALQLLKEEESVIIAGGTDLIVEIHQGKKIKERLIDISSLEEMKNIKEERDVITIGAGCTHSDISKNKLIKEKLSILAYGCSLVGSTTIRNRGTIGGNVVNSSTCADTVPPLLILEGKVKIKSAEEERIVELKDFFYNKGKVDLRKDEMVTEFFVKPLEEGYRWKLEKVGRRKSLAISRLTVAVAVKEKDGLIEDLRICSGAMLPKHSRLWKTESCFKGKIFDDKTIEEIGDSACKEAIALSGKRWSTEYKEPVLKGIITRALEELRMQGGEKI